MEKAIIGKKVGMTQIFDADGKVIPVTVIEAGPCTVVQKKTEEKDGYNAVQLGYGDVAERKLTKPELGHLKKAGDARKKTLKEFKLAKAAEMNVGDEVKAVSYTHLCGGGIGGVRGAGDLGPPPRASGSEPPRKRRPSVLPEAKPCRRRDSLPPRKINCGVPGARTVRSGGAAAALAACEVLGI